MTVVCISGTLINIYREIQIHKHVSTKTQIISCILYNIYSSYLNYSSASSVLDILKWDPLSSGRKFNCALLTYRCINGLTMVDLNLGSNQTVDSYNLWRRNDVRLPTAKTKWWKQRFSCQAIKELNGLDLNVRISVTLSNFVNSLKWSWLVGWYMDCSNSF